MARILTTKSKMEDLERRSGDLSNGWAEISERLKGVRKGLDMEISAAENIEASLLKAEKASRLEKEYYGKFQTGIRNTKEGIHNEDTSLMGRIRGFIAFVGAASGGGAAAVSGSNRAQGDTSSAVTNNNTTQSSQVPSTKHSVTSVNTGSSKTSAEAIGMKYYTQGKNYNKSWSSEAFTATNGTNYDYKSGVACGTCCDSMILSYFGIDKKPGDLIAENGGTCDFGGHYKNSIQGLGIERTNETAPGSLDAALAKYESDPDHVAPPVVSIKDEPSNHFIIVTGKNADGSYNIIDPASDGMTKLNVTTVGNYKSDSTTYTSNVKHVYSYSKK